MRHEEDTYNPHSCLTPNHTHPYTLDLTHSELTASSEKPWDRLKIEPKNTPRKSVYPSVDSDAVIAKLIVAVYTPQPIRPAGDELAASFPPPLEARLTRCGTFLVKLM